MAKTIFLVTNICAQEMLPYIYLLENLNGRACGGLKKFNDRNLRSPLSAYAAKQAPASRTYDPFAAGSCLGRAVGGPS